MHRKQRIFLKFRRIQDWEVQAWNSACDFGQYIHPLDVGCDAKLPARFLFHAKNPSVAAHPAVLARGQLGRQYQHKFDFRAFSHEGIGVEKYPVLADVAGVSARLHAISC
jgi:hypothetical protein